MDRQTDAADHDIFLANAVNINMDMVYDFATLSVIQSHDVWLPLASQLNVN